MKLVILIAVLCSLAIGGNYGYKRWKHRYICLKNPAVGVMFACGPADYMDMIVAPDKITHWEIWKPKKPKP